MRNSLFSLLIVTVLGCGSSQSKSTTTASAPPPSSEHAGGHTCPMMEAGAKMEASDTSDGIAIAVTTTGDVAKLREHVHHMADMHNQMAGEAHEGMSGADKHGDMKEMHMTPSHATVEDLPNGARLVLVPQDSSQLDALRAHVREHVAMMEKGECPKMGGMHAQPAPTDEHDAQQHHPAGT